MRIAWRRELASRGKLSCRPPVLAFAFAFAFALGWAPNARAEGAPKTVVMIVEPSALPLALRLRQELESLGLVVKWQLAEPARPPSLEQEATSNDAVASIRIAPMGGSDVDMTIFDPVTGKTVSWKVVAAGAAEPTAGELIATRSVELLRASLVQIAARAAVPAPAPTPRRPPLTTENPSADAATPDSFSVFVGPSVLYSADFRAAAHVLSGVTWMPLPPFGLGVSLLTPVQPARLRGPEGTVELYGSFYRLGAVLDATSPSSVVSLRLTAGAGLGRLQLRGNASSGYARANDVRLVAYPSLGVTARWALAPRVRLFVDVTGSTAFPKTVIRLAGREATEWGRPALGAALGVELSAPSGPP